MLIELIIFFSLIFCWWFPKWFFVDRLLEVFFPLVLTRRYHYKHISLTFNNCLPYGNHNDIIKLLDKHNMLGTFFIISDYINDSNKAIFVNAVKKGHQLGNHGKTESMHLLSSNLEAEILDCDKKIKEIYAEAAIPLPSKMLYRPGCGLFSPWMIRQVDNLCYKLALGSVYSNDSIIRSSLVNYYYLINHIEGGDVIILHDRSWINPLLEMLLPWLEKNNYTSVTMDTLFY